MRNPDVIFDEGVEVKYHVPDRTRPEEGYHQTGDGDDNTEIKSGEVGSRSLRFVSIHRL